jgi:uncharacterized integral membrane protein (TIGR00698 family)
LIPAQPTPKPAAIAFITLALVATCGPWSKPWISLLVGMAFGIAGVLSSWPWLKQHAKKLSRIVMLTCIILSGLRIDLHTLAKAATDGVVLAIATIAGAIGLGLLAGKLLGVGKELRLLISSGTAICGGSAIAAVGGAINASSAAMAISTACVFLLNAIALFVFPFLGHKLGLTEEQFGTWAGVAIHDMSSVAAAGQAYRLTPGSSVAYDVANVVKLTRVVWIVPLVFFGTWYIRRGEQSEASPPAKALTWKDKFKGFPYFIFAFVACSMVRTLVPSVAQIKPSLDVVLGVGFAIALFLIGLGLTQAALKQVGWKALVLGAGLWVVLSSATLAALKLGWA